MDYLELIQSIKEKLTSSGHQSVVDELVELQMSAGVPGEMLMMICSKLIEIRYTNKSAFTSVEDDADDLVKYAKSIGLEPRWHGKRL